MTARADLLALTPEKLAVLANRGLVKRATKMVESGRGPTISLEGEVVVAIDGDIRTELRPGVPLAECPCSCPASTVCRHRVAAVLAYQNQAGGAAETAAPWWPGDVSDDDVLQAIGKRTLQQATRVRQKGLTVVLRSGAECSAELPTCTVRFLVPRDLAYARCDCAAGTGCEHIAVAIWAFREGDRARTEQTVELGTRAVHAEGVLGPALVVVRDILLDGVEGASQSLAAAFAKARDPVEQAGMRWPADILLELEEELGRYRDKSAAYAAPRLSAKIAELHARERAARIRNAPLQRILGLGEPQDTALQHLRLISLGARVERDADALHCRVFLVDPSTAMVLVYRRSFPHPRADPNAAFADAPEPLTGARAAGRQLGFRTSLGALSHGQLVTARASRRANRELVIRRATVAQTTVTAQPGNWDELPEPIFVRDVASAADADAARPPRILRTRVLAPRVRAIAVDRVEDLGYRPSSQTLEARLTDVVGNAFGVTLEYSAAAPHAIDAAATALAGDAGELRFVSGVLRPGSDGLVVRPLALVTDRVIVPDLAGATARPPLPIRKGEPSSDPLRAELERARALVDRAAHVGLRHARDLPPRMMERAGAARALGLQTCAARLEALAEAVDDARVSPAEHRDDRSVSAWIAARLRLALALE
ncbi:MAG: hypothetical protein AAGF12_29485 [Myxococcota bacterium]